MVGDGWKKKSWITDKRPCPLNKKLNWKKAKKENLSKYVSEMETRRSQKGIKQFNKCERK